MPNDPIKHVVVLLLENHSFDQMLGCFKEIYPTLEGVDPAKPFENKDDSGKTFRQAVTTERQMLLDPHHEVEHVAVQLEDHNQGFVKDFARSFKNSSGQDCQDIMGYYPRGFLPGLHGLATEFTICDHWFSSLPGPTWPNRFFALTGTSNGRVDMPEDGQHWLDIKGWFEQDQPTIFDRLSEQGIHWKVYFHDIPQSCVLKNQRLPHNVARYFYKHQFYEDTRGLEADFPQFSFIEPDYMGADENDDHPPHDIMKAEKFIAHVYNAIRANQSLWESTLLVVYFDEHGGFYDHVEPPKAVPPDTHHEDYTFDRLGVRVPALLVSPWCKKGFDATQFDHTSLLKYLSDKWGLGPLGERTKNATSIGVALDLGGPPRVDVLPRIELTSDQLSPPDPEREEQANSMVSVHHLSLALMAQFIRIDVVEGLPRVITWAARLFETLKAACDGVLSGLYHERTPLKVSITQPDRISMDPLKPREDIAKFLKHQKQRAIPELAEKIRSTTATQLEKQHAVQTLGIITGRRFHEEAREDLVNRADAWLTKHGH